MTAARPGRRRDQRGQASMVLVLAVPALLVIALILITVLGDAVGKRTQTSTAADAAALAAAEEWRSYVEREIDQADNLLPAAALDRLRALLTTDAVLLDQGAVASRARELAAGNHAEVTSLSVRRTARGLEFAVATRNLDAVNQSTTKAEASATAVVELTAGACWRGPLLGLVYQRHCLDWAGLKDELVPEPPKATGGPSPTPTPSPSPTPSPTPKVALTPFRAETRLVA